MFAIRGVTPAVLILLASAGLDTSSVSHAQTYPSKVIRIVVPTGPGTPPDVISRVIAAELSERDGWRLVVENRPGALQTVGMADVLKQPADGYAIYPMTVPTMAVPALLPAMGLRPDADFTPVIKVSKSYNALVVPPSFPARSVQELIAVLGEGPDRFNFSSAGFGTPAHLIGEMFKLQTGVRATYVPYQQAQQRVADLLNGTNHFDFLATVTAADFLATGRLRALAVTAPDRIARLKHVPTVVEQGFPGLVVEDYVGLAVKRGTSGHIVARLNDAIGRALKSPRVRDAFANLGAEPVGGTSGAFGDLIEAQVAHWGKVVSESGIKMPQ
jgi:tripartite-type tricarboxylate transporter receptor subunit TctC